MILLRLEYIFLKNVRGAPLNYLIETSTYCRYDHIIHGCSVTVMTVSKKVKRCRVRGQIQLFQMAF